MKQVLYMDGAPIQHPGEKGKELPLKPCDMFNGLDAEHIFISAGKVEGFVNNIYRVQSFNEAYEELKTMEDELRKIQSEHNISDHYRAERRIRSYFIEADLFFSHWKKMLGSIKKSSGVDIYAAMEQKYKNDINYALLRIIRNYIMHSGDVIHRAHSGLNGDVGLWADIELLKKDIRDKGDRNILEKVGRIIDLIKLADDANPLVLKIQEYFMKSVAEKDKRYDLKAECEYLNEMRKRIVMYRSNDWFVFSYNGLENVEVGLPYIGGVPGLSVNYYRLDWQMYKELGDWLKNVV